MKFNFKKVATVVGSMLMVGATMGMAVAASYPTPFIKSGAADVAVVIGSNVALSDAVAATNIGAALSSKLGVTTTDTGASATGGDSINLATSSRKLYYGDAINSAIPTLTYTELPDVLEDGTFTDLSGTQYDYSQTVSVGTAPTAFGTSGGDIDDPELILDVGTTTPGSLYNYTLRFNKNLNVSDSTNVQGQKIKILGVDYVIGSSSTNSTLYLYGSGKTIIVAGGESTTVEVGGNDHTIELVTTSQNGATISVDGVSKSVVEGSSYAFAGDINVYIKDIIHPAYAGDLRQAELIVGANTLKLVDGTTVKEGADETSIKGTKATIAAAGQGLISGFTVSIAMPKSSNDHIAAGESFTDPVFGGLKVEFAGAVPALDSDARATIVLDTDNNQFTYATFTSAKAGTAGEQKITYTYDNNTASDAVAPILAHQVVTTNNQGLIHVVEGENARVGDWIVINQGDAGTIIEVDDISIDSATSGTVTFLDVIGGGSQIITLTNTTGNQYNKTGVSLFGGVGYTVKAAGDETTVNITWNSGATAIFPRIKLANGGWIAFMQNTTVANGTVLFPDGLTTLNTVGTTVNGTASLTSTQEGIIWNVTNGTNKITGIANPACSFTTGPAILFLEPKKWDDGNYGNFICIPMSTYGTNPEIGIGSPVFNGTNSGFVTLNSDTYVQEAVDKYGTMVSKESRSNENGKVTIKYPKSQMYLDVLFTSESAVVTPGSAGSTGTAVSIVPVYDSEVSTVQSKNLIVVGGSCINTVAAKLLGSNTALCGADFTAKTDVASGQYLIQTFDSPYTTDKVAMLVAGYNAADTTKASTYLTNLGSKIDTTAGKKYVGTSATEATLVTTTSTTTDSE